MVLDVVVVVVEDTVESSGEDISAGKVVLGMVLSMGSATSLMPVYMAYAATTNTIAKKKTNNLSILKNLRSPSLKT